VSLGVIFGVTYPFLVHFGLERHSIRLIATVVLIASASRLVATILLRRTGPARVGAEVASASLVALAVVAMVTDRSSALLWYPVVMNLVLFLIFAESIARPPTLIEKWARWRHGELPEAGRRYCRNVTIYWSGFFVVNGAVALSTIVSGDRESWLVYNGMISYILIALSFAVELCIRSWFRRKHRAAIDASGMAGGSSRS